ncbi:MAG: O-antigen ligase family protein [Planctomycetota bacterium]
MSFVFGCLVAGIVFINAADFRGDTGDEFKVHWQIYLRLLNCAVCGGVAILFLHRSLDPYCRFPGLVLSCLFGWTGLTSVASLDPKYSAAAFVSLCCVALLVPAAMRVLGGQRFILAVAFGFVTYLVGSWIAYLLFPQVGVFKEQVSQTDVFERMGGLGHPNELGCYAASTVVLFVALAYRRCLHWHITLPSILLGCITLVACYSRTWIVLTAVGVAMVYRDHWGRPTVFLSAMLVVLLVMAIVGMVYASGGLDWMISDALLKVSKSGNADELSTGTGRTEIWAYGIEQIAHEPLKGYGYGMARFVMEDHSYHCHNTFLNYCMATGLPGGLLFLTLAIYLIHRIVRDPRPEMDGLTTMILLGGMVEGLLIAPAPSAATMLFIVAVFWRHLDMKLTVRNPSIAV